MKNKIIYIFALILFSVFVIVWQSNQQEQIASSTNPDLIPVKEALFELQNEKSFQQLSKNEKLKRTYQILEQIPEEYKTLKHQYQIAMSDLPDITLHGRVIDQNGQPVNDADVYYEVVNNYLGGGGGRGRVKTDKDGYFEIDTEAAELDLWGIRHPEVQEGGYSKSTNTNLNIKSSNMYPDWSVHNTKDNPYIILAWRSGKYEGAFSGRSGGHLNASGTISTLRFTDKRNAVQRFEGEQAGHLRVSCTRTPMESNRDYGDWSVHITPINGGIQETDDLYRNVAPEAGYLPSLDIVMQKGSQGYEHALINKHYYFMSNNGKEYGSLRINFEPFAKIEHDEDERVCIIRINYKLNPTGSRNLELKRNNTSQPKLPTVQKLALWGAVTKRT